MAINPITVAKMVDDMQANPGDEFDLNDPPGLEAAVMAEITRRENNRKHGDIINGKSVPHEAIPQSKSQVTAQTREDRYQKMAADPKIGPDRAGEEFRRNMKEESDRTLGQIAPSSPFGAAVSGIGQGITAGFIDEGAGLANSIGYNFMHPGEPVPKEEYEGPRDLVRGYQDEAADEQPVANAAGMLGGALLTPTPNLPGGAVARGAQVGAVSGAGMSKGQNLDEVGEDMQNGAVMGGMLGAAGQKIGDVAARGARNVMSAADKMISQAIGMTSDEITELQISGQFESFMARARELLGFGGAQSARDAIEIPAAQQGLEGSMSNPGLTTHQKIYNADRGGAGVPSQKVTRPQIHPKSWAGGNREVDMSWPRSMPTNESDATLMSVHGEPSMWEGASSEDINGLMASNPNASKMLAPRSQMSQPSVSSGYGAPDEPGPAMNETDQFLSGKFRDMADRGGGGILPKSGLTPSTFKGGIGSAVMARAEQYGGVGFHRVAQAMRNSLTLGDQAAGLSRVGTSKLMQLIDIVDNSQDPALEDYLAQEADPSYRSLRMQVDNEQREAENKSK